MLLCLFSQWTLTALEYKAWMRRNHLSSLFCDIDFSLPSASFLLWTYTAYKWFFFSCSFFFVFVKDLLKYDIDFLYEICKSTLNYQRKNVGTLLSFCSSSVFGTYSLFCFNVGETLHLKVRNLEWHLWSGAKKKVYMCIKAQVRKKSVNLLSYRFAFLTKV